MSLQVDNSVRAPNEIRVKADARLFRYVKYAMKCLSEGQRTLMLKGTGTATSKVLQLTEILKRRIGNLYQTNKLYSVHVESRRDSRDGDEMRRISVFESVLSMDPLDRTDVGYQEPVPKEESGRPLQRRPGYHNYRSNGHRDNGYGRQGGFYSQENYGPQQHQPYKQHDEYQGMLSYFCNLNFIYI